MKRSKHNLSHYALDSFDMGQFETVMCMEVLPGDSIRHALSALVRVAPLVAPVMHPVHIHVGSWFVPNRLVWTGWESFITDPDSGLTIPRVQVRDSGGPVAGSANLGRRLGLGDMVDLTSDNLSVNALPFRAYNLIWNEFIRDQDIDTPLTVTTGNGPDTTSNYAVRQVRWEKDYFTTARAAPQMGTAETVAVDAFVVEGGSVVQLERGGAGAGAGVIVNQAGGAAGTDLNLGANFSIERWRVAMAEQKLREHRNRFGSRYTDVLASYGIRPSDARLQRPEYLGGGRSTIAFSEVLATAEVPSGSVVGEQAGHGIATVRTRPYKRFFEEHGYILTMMWIRPKTVYVKQTRRDFFRSAISDYWTPESELQGDQSITIKELWADVPAANADVVFGYAQRHDEYRRHPSRVTGEFANPAALGPWTFARDFTSQPALNSTFLEVDVSTDPFADISGETDQVRCMIYNQVAARRLVRKFARNG